MEMGSSLIFLFSKERLVDNFFKTSGFYDLLFARTIHLPTTFFNSLTLPGQL